MNVNLRRLGRSLLSIICAIGISVGLLMVPALEVSAVSPLPLTVSATNCTIYIQKGSELIAATNTDDINSGDYLNAEGQISIKIKANAGYDASTINLILNGDTVSLEGYAKKSSTEEIGSGGQAISVADLSSVSLVATCSAGTGGGSGAGGSGGSTPTPINFVISMDAASKSLLSDSNNFRMSISDGGTPVEATLTDGQWKTSVPAGAERYNFGFSINRAYFIPYLSINGERYDTFDCSATGGLATGESWTNIGVAIPGSAVGGGNLTFDLTLGKRPNTNYSGATGLANVEAEYLLVNGGQSTGMSNDLQMSVASTAVDSSVAGGVATFDINLNNGAVTETAANVDVAMELDTSVFTASNYTLVREHNGVRTEIPADYDAGSGVIRFSSNMFSGYTLVSSDKPAATPQSDAKPQAEEQRQLDNDEKLAIEEEALPINTVSANKNEVKSGDEVVIPSGAYNMSAYKTLKGFVAGLNKAANANPNAKQVVIYTGTPFCLNKNIIETVRKSGKSVVYYFSYKGHIYSVTIPNTADATALLESNGFAGPLYVGNKLGTTKLIK